MTFTELNQQPPGREIKNYTQFNHLVEELKKRELPDEIVDLVNQEIEKVNAVTQKTLARQLVSSRSRVVKELEKRLKIVPKNFYRNRWVAIGLAAFGIPIGVVLGSAIGSMAYLGIGLPIGIAIGAGMGISMDKKAQKEGRQLDVEIG